MSDHDVRRALATFADTTPFLDPKAGLGERLARRARARRAGIAAAACFAAVVAGTGVAALTRDRDTAAVVATDDLPSESPAAESPTPDGSPTASPDPSGDPTPGATDPTVRPSGSAEPGSPAKPIVRTAGGSDGLRVRVTFAPGSVASGTAGTLSVVAEDDDGMPQVAGLSWGDGTHEAIAVMVASCVSRRPPLLGSPSPRPKSPGSLDRDHRHAWRHPGRYTVTVKVASSVMCSEGEVPAEDHTLTFDVVVTAGEVTSNGPEAPRMEHLDWEPSEEDRTVHLSGTVTDDDGWVSKVTIEWGDGTRTTFRDEDMCTDDGGKHYPQHGFALIDREHTYPAEDGYTVTVTVTTTGCDGRDGQTATETLDVAA